MQKSSICLWFNGHIQEAVNFYLSVFPDGKIEQNYFSKVAPPKDKSEPLTINFEMGGQAYMALNGNPQSNFTQAFSIMVHCDTQEEIDYYWNKLSVGGKELQCGWLTDKFGISWQIVPSQLGKWFQSSDPDKADRVLKAVMGMVKLDMETLKNA